MTQTKGRLTEIDIPCSGCGNLYTIKLRLPKSRDESDELILKFLHKYGWTGEPGMVSSLKCRKCNGKPPSKQFEKVKL